MHLTRQFLELNDEALLALKNECALRQTLEGALNICEHLQRMKGSNSRFLCSGRCECIQIQNPTAMNHTDPGTPSDAACDLLHRIIGDCQENDVRRVGNFLRK